MKTSHRSRSNINIFTRNTRTHTCTYTKGEICRIYLESCMKKNLLYTCLQMCGSMYKKCMCIYIYTYMIREHIHIHVCIYINTHIYAQGGMGTIYLASDKKTPAQVRSNVNIHIRHLCTHTYTCTQGGMGAIYLASDRKTPAQIRSNANMYIRNTFTHSYTRTQGGMGTIYLASDRKNPHKSVAV